MITIYGLKNCDTCRKALKALRDGGHQVCLSDLRENPMDPKLLQAALAQFGDALVNRRSTTCRGLDDAARATAPLELLQTTPALMKRPLIEHNSHMTLGWDQTVRAHYLSA